MEYILYTWNINKYVARIFCELTKAFDCVNQELLIHTLQFYGSRGETLDCFRSYLFDKKQRLKMKLISTIAD
jgi:hypothetical protein